MVVAVILPVTEGFVADGMVGSNDWLSLGNVTMGWEWMGMQRNGVDVEKMISWVMTMAS